jgi:hypothetical protein
MIDNSMLTADKTVDKKAAKTPAKILDKNQAKAAELGWLDEDGICQFPTDVVAVVNGWKMPGTPHPELLSPEQLQTAIDRAWIQFQSGDGTWYTYDDYVATFSDYPSPVWMLEQRGDWPPGKKPINHIP